MKNVLNISGIFSVVSDPKQMEHLSELSHEILAAYPEGRDPINFDPYDLYLLGMISRRLGDTDRATDFLFGALKGNSNIWGAWVELSFLIVDRKHVCLFCTSEFSNNVLLRFIVMMKYRLNCYLISSAKWRRRYLKLGCIISSVDTSIWNCT